jgi:signal transduction histidine kinase
MANIGDLRRQARLPSKVIERLVRIKARGFRSVHFLIIWSMVALFVFLAYFYYRSFYDVYAIFLFAPLIYAAIVYRLRGAFVGSVIFIAILVPHTLPLSFDAYILVRSFVYIVFPFVVSSLVAVSLNYFQDQVEGFSEIVTLNETLNSYIERLETSRKQLIQVEKMNALGQLSAAIAHEINNPLSGVLVYTQLLQKVIKAGTFNSAQALDILGKMEMALSHSSKLVRNLLDFARQTTPVLKPLAISTVLDQVFALVGHQAQLNKVKVIRDEAPSLPRVVGDFGQLQQVFVNLVINAIQAMSNGGDLRVSSYLTEDESVAVAVSDTGVGIPPENMEKLFTPFFSTKEAVKGVGLGLAVSYGIVERHGGHIDVKSEVGKGSTFTVFLRAAVADGASAAAG